MHWDQLKNQVYEASKQGFHQLLESHKSEDIYALALYTDSGAMSVSASANSVERYAEKVDADLDDEDKTGDNLAYYKWSTSEWAYEAADGESFALINKLLRENDERENFSSFKKGLLNVMTESLAQLVSEGFFENLYTNRSNYVVFVSITDDDDAESVENESAEVINSRPTYDEFLKRYGAGADHLQGS
jgi:hypothetical protein